MSKIGDLLQVASKNKDSLPIIGYIGHVNQWIYEESKRRGWRIINLWHNDFNYDETQLSGVFTTNLPDEKKNQLLLNKNIPVVRLGNFPHPKDNKIPVVLYDYYLEGAMAAELFVSRGFKNIGYFGYTPLVNKELFNGFKDRGQELKAKVHLCQYDEIHSLTSEERKKIKKKCFQKWIKSISAPLGVLSSGSWLATNLSAWSEQVGVVMPNEFALISREDEKKICNCSMPSITYIEQDSQLLAKKACDLLDDLMKGKTVKNDVNLIPPKRIIQNESTQSSATNDHLVIETLDYISKNIDVNLSVEEIAKSVGVSSRQLNRRFLKAIHRTVNEEYRNQKIEVSKRLLFLDDLSVEEISKMTGFNSESYFCRTFKSVTGVKPSEFKSKKV
jgi:LacI family transcriptional regulator